MEAALLALLPIALHLALANLADRYRNRPGEETGVVLAAIAHIGTVIVYLGLLGLGILFVVVGTLITLAPPPGDASGLRDLPFPPSALPNLGAALALPSLAGLVVLLRPVRSALARLLPIDPRSTVHAVALAYVPLVIINLTASLAIGLDTLATLVEREREQAGLAGASEIVALWAQALLWVVFALAGVGLFTRRSWSACLHRLGLVRPSWGQIGLGLGLSVSLVFAVALIVGLARANNLLDPNVERLSEALLGPLSNTAIGILTIALAASIGEEILFRGALQPRFGLVATSLVFTLLHAQYGLSVGTFVVFAVALILGLIRQRTNTTVAIVTHAGYNGLLAVAALVLPQTF